MTSMYRNILDPKQEELVPLVASFAPAFYLVGGTSLALQYGHRRSIDFDLFSDTPIDTQKIRNKIRSDYRIEQTLVSSGEELTISVNSVKCTFFYYPYAIPHPVGFTGDLTMPDPVTIAAMKAFALGHRAKWKDYVDLYFVFQHHTLQEVVTKAKRLFDKEFEEKLFREQLAFHQDINYTDSVIYMPGFELPHSTILEFLTTISIS